MSRTLLVLAFPSVLLACRGNEPVITDYSYPILAVSQSTVEFGSAGWGETSQRSFYVSNDGGTSLENGMTMAVSAVTLLDTAAENYIVSYDIADITCAGGAAPVAPDTAAASKALDVDTGTPPETGDSSPDSDTDTASGGDTGTALPPGVLFTLDPGCRLPISVQFGPTSTTAVGDVWGAIQIDSASQEIAEDATDDEFLAAYHKDPVRLSRLVYLHGEAEHSAGVLVVRPRTYDFGYVNPEDSDDHVTFIKLDNVGDGDLDITGVAFATTCDPAFSLVSTPAIGTLSAGGSTLAEIRFAPTDDQAAYCQLIINSTDPAAADVDVTLTGNSGSAPDNEPPTVFIRSPENGYKYSAIRPLEMEINIFDVNQPAGTLGCKIKSVVQGSTVGTCSAPDDSGHFFLDIDPGDLDAGSDTLQVVVTDGSGITATASVSVVIGVDYPVDDNDGDGYGSLTEENHDCDEDNRNTFPGASELPDGVDNDCDGIVDEGTSEYDDDGDAFTENEGDCSDFNDSAYPGAPERGDGVDNDCDGLVDEGTSLYDDDQDGYAEVNNDCDDTDAAVNPSAIEECDGIDNNCNGLRDSADACVGTSTEPIVVGGDIGVWADQYACESGQTITLQVVEYDADGQVPTYSWQSTDADAAQFDNTSGATVHWTCPTLEDNSGGKAYLISVSVVDTDAQADYAYTKIAVYPEDYGLYDTYQKVVIPEKKSGCSSSGTAPALSLMGLGLVMVGLRRRRWV